jgi:PAS domain S-box-containing protein
VNTATFVIIFGLSIVFHLFRTTHQELQAHRDSLQVLVDDRTRELEAANLALRKEYDEHKQADEEIVKRERFLNAIIENLPNMIFVKDAKELRFVRFNKAGEDLLGYSREEMIGKNGHDIFLEEEADFFTKTDKEVLDKGVLLDISEEPVQTKYKGRRVLHTKKIPILGENKIVEYLLGISEDITERKQIEERLRQTQKIESVANLAGGIAHDFNNLLSPIIGFSELLLMDLPASSKEHRNVQQIMAAGVRGSELVKQILNLSRKSENLKAPIRIQQVLKEVFSLSRSTIPVDIEIQQDIQPDCGVVMADPTKIHQIAMNLITNAYHAMNQSSGEIIIRLKETVLGVDDLIGSPLQPGKYATLRISDTGCGIDPGITDRIFEPYFTTKEMGKGTGLGLAVVYGIVKEHGGDIQVESELGKGTVFTLHFPLMEQLSKMDTVLKTVDLQTGNEKILLVDDDGSIVELEKQILERLGYEVTSRTSSLDALTAFRANPDAFDIVITDMTMPNMTGDQLSKELISIKPDLHIILCTGFSEKIDKENAMAIGIKGFLMKPVVQSQIAPLVREVLDGTKKDAYA